MGYGAMQLAGSMAFGAVRRLTSAGHRLLPFLARIAKLFAGAQSAASDDGPPKGPLLLGAMETTLALRGIFGLRCPGALSSQVAH